MLGCVLTQMICFVGIYRHCLGLLSAGSVPCCSWGFRELALWDNTPGFCTLTQGMATRYMHHTNSLHRIPVMCNKQTDTLPFKASQLVTTFGCNIFGTWLSATTFLSACAIINIFIVAQVQHLFAPSLRPQFCILSFRAPHTSQILFHITSYSASLFSLF